MTSTGLSTGRAWYAVVLFGMLYIVAFIDRMILGLLVEPMKAALHVGDAEISLLIGFNFALFYSIVGIPLGRLADRGNRRNLILISTIVWTACTLASGFATAFWVLCALRLGVAVGEAALSPSVISLIGDMFPREKRPTPTAIYMCFGAFGATSAYIFGGIVVRLLKLYPLAHLPLVGPLPPWRMVFLAVAAPAVVLTVLFALTIKEPPRETGSGDLQKQKPMFAWTSPRWLPLISLFGAGAIGQAISIGFSAWAPTYMFRHFGMDVASAGISLGVSTMIFGLSGMLIIPPLTARWTRAGRADALPLVLLFGTIVGTLGGIGAALAPTPAVFVVCYGFSALGIMGTGLLLMIAIQLVALPRMRAELMAVCLIFNSLFAMGSGPTLVTSFAQWFGHGQLQPGFLGTTLVCGPISAFLILIARKGYVRMARDAEATDQKTSVPPPSITSVTPLI